ncbi:MAG: hypothetical protein ACPG32_12770 [Akkermansiaceae bacterium]
MKYSFTHGKAQYIAEMKIKGEPYASDTRLRYFQEVALYWLLFAFGSWISYQAEHLFGFAVFSLALVYSLIKQLPYNRVLNEEYDRAAAHINERTTVIEVQEDGLLETECGVSSFCPWAAITQSQFTQGILFMYLKTGERAIIDESTLSADSSALSELVELLKTKDIPHAAVG